MGFVLVLTLMLLNLALGYTLAVFLGHDGGALADELDEPVIAPLSGTAPESTLPHEAPLDTVPLADSNPPVVATDDASASTTDDEPRIDSAAARDFAELAAAAKGPTT